MKGCSKHSQIFSTPLWLSPYVYEDAVKSKKESGLPRSRWVMSVIGLGEDVGVTHNRAPLPCFESANLADRAKGLCHVLGC